MALLESVMKAERPEKHDAAFTVTMIHYSKLIPSVKNDYSVENIVELANAILLAGGVKQNLLARKKAPDEYELIAGHRRHLAVKYLVETMGCEAFAMVPVHVEKAGDVMSEIQLILTNSSARERSDYEKMVEVSKLTHLMRTLQNGSPEDKTLFRQIFGRETDIGGREFRKVVAEKLGLSETKVANLNNIERNLVPDLKDKFQDGRLGVSAANAAASLPIEKQMELAQREEIRVNDVRAITVSESDTGCVDTSEMMVEPDETNKPVELPEEKTGQEEAENNQAETRESEWIGAMIRDVQPTLPVMKNNDQRKAFIKNYRTWPIWFRVPQASEIYYRYDFEDGCSFVICEYKYYVVWMEKYKDMNPECTSRREYLLKPGYHYLHDCMSNETAMVDYLRKRGA